MFCSDDGNDFPESFSRFVQTFSDRTVSSLPDFDLSGYLDYVVLLNISVVYKW